MPHKPFINKKQRKPRAIEENKEVELKEIQEQKRIEEEPDALDALDALLLDEAMNEPVEDEEDEFVPLSDFERAERTTRALEFLGRAKANDDLEYKEGFATHVHEMHEDEDGSYSHPIFCRREAPGVYTFIFPEQLLSKEMAFMGEIPQLHLGFSYFPYPDRVDVTVNINHVQKRNPIVSIVWA